MTEGINELRFTLLGVESLLRIYTSFLQIELSFLNLALKTQQRHMASVKHYYLIIYP